MHPLDVADISANVETGGTFVDDDDADGCTYEESECEFNVSRKDGKDEEYDDAVRSSIADDEETTEGRSGRDEDDVEGTERCDGATRCGARRNLRAGSPRDGGTRAEDEEMGIVVGMIDEMFVGEIWSE